MRDIVLVARFEILRAVRTWRAAALIALYCVASGGGTWLFTRFVGAMENTLAAQLGVRPTDTPGSMLAELVKSPVWREVLEAMTGSSELVDQLVHVPPLALHNLWFGLLVVPFFASTAAAESVSIDVQTRAIRYEILRTGRFELALGRFFGQLVLTAAASALATVVAYAVGLAFLLGQDPLTLGLAMLSNVPRTWFFGVPFVAFGTAASLWTRAPAWSRVIALVAVAGTWVAYGVLDWLGDASAWQLVVDAITPVLPQSWWMDFWQPALVSRDGGGWWGAAAACSAIAACALMIGYARFHWRDL